ncbi:MAG: DUF4294 domain-containing protein [Bacteroidia bacterium]
MAKNILIVLLLFPLLSWAQTIPTNGQVVRGVIIDGDTIPYIVLPVVETYSDRIFKNQREKAKWERLRYNVKIVYPYAIMAAARLKEYDRVLSQIANLKEREVYTKDAEAHLKKEFGDDLKKLTVSQGRILIKLIDRETGKTTYDVVKNMRGSFSAFMWQSVAIMFNSSLKYDYDPKGDDQLIETAIKLIEDGQ